MNAKWKAYGHLDTPLHSLEYICVGPPPCEAPTLVLLHEGLGSARLWRKFPEELSSATGLGVFAYSRAGYGYSDLADLPRRLNYMTEEAQTALPNVLDAIGIEHCILVGHSDGATIAAIYAGSNLELRVDGLVLMAPHFFTEAIALEQIARAKVEFDSGDLRTRLSKYHCNAECAFRGWNEAWLHPEFQSWNVSEYLDHIQVPILAIQGRQDQYGSLAQIDEISRRCSSPVTTLILDSCRHAPFLDQPQLVLSKANEFTKQIYAARKYFKHEMNSKAEHAVLLPEYAHMPGQNQRHPEDAFDAIKASVTPNLSINELALTKAFQYGLSYLEHGYYWEAHEVLEPIWLNLPTNCVEKKFVQGLIQTANACLKLRMQRPKAATRLCVISRQLLTACEAATCMGVNRSDIVAIIENLEQQISFANKCIKNNKW